MPWKECHVMDERRRFVARLLEGEKMAPRCAAFGISRKTGYKIFDRYGLPRGIHARQSAVLLPAADDHGLRQPLPPDVRGALDDAGDIRIYRLRAHLQRIWVAG